MMNKVVIKITILIQEQVYMTEDTTCTHVYTTDSEGTQQEMHNNRTTKRYTTGETTEKLQSKKFRGEVRAHRKKSLSSD